MKKSNNPTKSKIVSAAWQLFYEQGFDSTTVDEIVKLSGTSKGSFYHYFESKDSLIGSLAYLFDEKYTELEKELDYGKNAVDNMLFLTHELCMMIENNIDIGLLSRLYAQQLSKRGEKELLDHSRMYYRLLKRLVQLGQERGEITRQKSAAEIVRMYAIAERALLYDWCLHGGEYPLTEYACTVISSYLSGLRADKN
ncbi:MAG: TetR/AcrR family transcriptional regulator [Ruminococcus sp.]|uniref:TetR/AcrR family transcriptional regulator n=1 Tax=Ruminococcus sp. TaxID=41978 RepID=UPI002873B490|nr:TetR/AcrR family transcriptional regulator [Ruminococcus sp.]MBQ3285617.1 TetR/AcrR family transcriptional regulator [Ruminococcus sp.]